VFFSMPGRVNTEVATLDVKWKKDKIDWKRLEQKFLIETEDFLGKIDSVEVTEVAQAPIMSKITFVRNPIGGTG
jgi:hypothetical protein